MSKLAVFHTTSIGASHIKEGKVCQDFALSSAGSDYAVVIVCDGHGGNKYFRSDRGSRIAAEQAHISICEFMKSQFVKSKKGGKLLDTLMRNPDSHLKQLSANIIFRWREAIYEDIVQEPFTDAEKKILSSKEINALLSEEGWVSAYGTTLLLAVRTKNFWFGLHIGDGKCVAVNSQGEFSQPIPWDVNCFLNQTTSLCDDQALNRFRYIFSKENLPKAVFIATDGLDDTFGNDEALHSFYKVLLQIFSEKGLSGGIVELQTYLPELSEKGSQDDISIAGIICNKS